MITSKDVTMKTAPPKLLSIIAGCVLIASLSGLSGCASNSGCNSWMPSNPFKNRPVRNTIKSWFQGDACSTCNAPAGQPLHFGTNTAPLCTSCGSAVTTGYPPAVGTYDSNVSLYGDTSINGPTPIYPETGVIQNGGVVGEIEGAFGSGITNGAVNPPQF